MMNCLGRGRLLALMICAGAAASISGGQLDPPASPAPTSGPEPRVAVNAANTPGDGGSAFRITAPGSYHLAGNVSAETGGIHGIVIAADNVTLDLNGFSLFGEPGGASGAGITVSGTRTGLTVLNGTVQGWGEAGVDLASTEGCAIRAVRAVDNAGGGIDVGGRALVTACHALANSGENASGISVGPGSIVRDCVAASNSKYGIAGGSGSTVSGCSAAGNGANGINVLSGSSVSQCVARDNLDSGIATGDAVSVIDCVSTGHGGGNGIAAATRCRIEGNLCEENDTGIEFGNSSLVRSNTCVLNLIGIRTPGGGSRIEANTVSTSERSYWLEGVLAVNNLVVRNSSRNVGTDHFLIEVPAGNQVATVQTDINAAGPWDNLQVD